MAPYSNWRWSCLLIAIVVPSNLATEQTDTTSASTTPRSGVWTWPIVFMHSKVIYLNLSTMEYPDINCIKEYRVTWNHSARLMTKMMWIGSSTGNWERIMMWFTKQKAIVGQPKHSQLSTAVDL
uniref:Putative lipocalin 46 n=1 Tax=Rhipicephalus microplus TaxID=6941 RepID=A0A6G5A7C5_RHIMP